MTEECMAFWDIPDSQIRQSGHTTDNNALGASAHAGAGVIISFSPHQTNMKVWITIKETVLPSRNGANLSFPTD